MEAKENREEKREEEKPCFKKQIYFKWISTERCVTFVITVGALVIAIFSLINSAKIEGRLRKEFDLKIARIAQEIKPHSGETLSTDKLQNVSIGRLCKNLWIPYDST